MSKPSIFRKKPVEIEAMLFEGGAENATPIVNWILSGEHAASWSEAYEAWDYNNKEYYEVPETISINTLEGTMAADVGDWIIKGVKGEFYPCKPDIFKATYEEVPQPLAMPVFLDPIEMSPAELKRHQQAERAFMSQSYNTPTWLEN